LKLTKPLLALLEGQDLLLVADLDRERDMERRVHGLSDRERELPIGMGPAAVQHGSTRQVVPALELREVDA